MRKRLTSKTVAYAPGGRTRLGEEAGLVILWVPKAWGVDAAGSISNCIAALPADHIRHWPAIISACRSLALISSAFCPCGPWPKAITRLRLLRHGHRTIWRGCGV